MPMPVQRPIPIWFGGSSDAVVTRAARLGDGWMPIMTPDAQAEQKLRALREQLNHSAATRPSSALRPGYACMARTSKPGRPRRTAGVGSGADMVMLYPMYRITTVDDHIESLRRFNEIVRG